MPRFSGRPRNKEPGQKYRGACEPQPTGRGGGRPSAALPLLDDAHRHRLRGGALHLPARRSRQNANLFLREPLALLIPSPSFGQSRATAAAERVRIRALIEQSIAK